MGARDQIGVAYIAQRACVGIGDAGQCQLMSHFLGPWAPAVAQGVQTLLQWPICAVKAQAYDMDGVAGIAGRNLHPREVVQALGMCGLAGSGLPGQLVVVGQ